MQLLEWVTTFIWLIGECWFILKQLSYYGCSYMTTGYIRPYLPIKADVSLLSAVSTSGVVGHNIMPESYDLDYFLKFFSDLL